MPFGVSGQPTQRHRAGWIAVLAVLAVLATATHAHADNFGSPGDSWNLPIFAVLLALTIAAIIAIVFFPEVFLPEFLLAVEEGGAETIAEEELETELFSRGVARTNLDVFENGGGLARTQDTVASLAERAGVDLRGVDVEIVEDPEMMRYLDVQGAGARTWQPTMGGPPQIQLGPASFADEETLVKTIAHEYTHVVQLTSGVEVSAGAGGAGTIADLEAEAYASEIPAWERFLEGLEL